MPGNTDILLSQLLSALLQLLLLAGIPFLWYAATHRGAAGFFSWVGLRPAKRTPAAAAAGLFGGFLLTALLPYWYLYRTGCLTYSGLVVDSFRETGWSAQTVLVVLLWAVVQTSLTEEIFFRGFLCKRFSALWGWRIGSALQAALFGAIHLPAVWGTGALPAALVVLLTGGIGFALGWLSLRRAEGSILYGWGVHAAVNVLSSLMVCALLL